MIVPNVNGDPHTHLFSVTLQITTGEYTYNKYIMMGGSNYKEAAENAVNCYKRWYPDSKIEAK